MGYHASLCKMFGYEFDGANHRSLSRRIHARALAHKPEGVTEVEHPPSTKRVGEDHWTDLPWAVHHFYVNDNEQLEMEQRFKGKWSEAPLNGTLFHFELLEDAMLLFLTPISEIEIDER